MPVPIVGLEPLAAMLEVGHNIMLTGPVFNGKSSFGVQFLESGLGHGEAAVIISTNDTAEGVLKKATRFGWDLEPFEKDGRLRFLDCYSRTVGLSATGLEVWRDRRILRRET